LNRFERRRRCCPPLSTLNGGGSSFRRRSTRSSLLLLRRVGAEADEVGEGRRRPDRLRPVPLALPPPSYFRVREFAGDAYKGAPRRSVS
jgi:hypothetical protein